MAKKRHLFLDLSTAQLPSWWPKDDPNFPKLLPLRPARRRRDECEFDLLEDRLPADWRERLYRVQPLHIYNAPRLGILRRLLPEGAVITTIPGL